MIRGPLRVWISPALPLVMLPCGFVKFAWFIALNISQRYWILTRSVTAKFLNRPKSSNHGMRRGQSMHLREISMHDRRLSGTMGMVAGRFWEAR